MELSSRLTKAEWSEFRLTTTAPGMVGAYRALPRLGKEERERMRKPLKNGVVSDQLPKGEPPKNSRKMSSGVACRGCAASSGAWGKKRERIRKPVKMVWYQIDCTLFFAETVRRKRRLPQRICGYSQGSQRITAQGFPENQLPKGEPPKNSRKMSSGVACRGCAASSGSASSLAVSRTSGVISSKVTVISVYLPSR